MGNRVTISDPVRLTNRRATATTLRRPVRLDTIRVRDHRPVLTAMTGLTALPTPRTLLLRPLLPRFRRIARRRQRTVTRATTDLPLELLDPRHQRQHQIDDRLRITLDRRPQLLTPHTARFPATSRNPLRTPDDPLNAYPLPALICPCRLPPRASRTTVCSPNPSSSVSKGPPHPSSKIASAT